MPFTNGHPKMGGRRKGVPNRATEEVRELARQILEDPAYQRRLRERVRAGEAPSIEAMLWQYAYGRPQQTSETSSETLALKDVLEQLWRQHQSTDAASSAVTGASAPRRTPAPKEER